MNCNQRKLENKLAKSITLCLLVSGMTLGTAWADSMEQFELDPMVVTATRYETRDMEIPAATEVFDQKKIEQLGAQNAMDVVKNIPGFTLTVSPTGNTYIGFRGIAKDNVAILVNGTQLNQDGNYDLESISTDIIDRIEVVKGGSAVLYGSNASAGVINIITKKGAAGSRIRLGGGDKHRFAGSVTAGLENLNVSYARNQSRDRGAIYQSNPSKFYLGDKMEKDSLGIEYQPAEHVALQYMYSNKVSDTSIENAGTVMPGFHSEVKYHFGQVRYSNRDLRATVFGRNRDWKFNSIGRPVTTHQKGHNIGVDVQNRWNFSGLNLTGGFEYEKENTKNFTDLAPAKRDKGAVFFVADKELGENTKIFLGAREAYVEESGSKFCPQFQVLHALGEDNNLYVNVNRSMRAPHVNEQWETSRQFANLDLKAENGWNYEIGWKRKFDADDLFKVNIYHMDLNDRIFSERTTIGSVSKNIYRNAEKYRNTGVEMSYERALDDRFHMNVGMSYGNPEQSTKGKWNKVDYRLGMNAGIGYAFRDTSANLNANYMGKRINGTKHMVDLDFNIKQKIGEDKALRLVVNNLLNRHDIRTGSSSGISGSLLEERNWLLSFEHKF